MVTPVWCYPHPECKWCIYTTSVITLNTNTSITNAQHTSSGGSNHLFLIISPVTLNRLQLLAMSGTCGGLREPITKPDPEHGNQQAG
jgi:hypothetical protein